MAIISINEETDFESVKRQAKTYLEEVESFANTAHENATSVSNSIDDIVFVGSWEDDAADKFRQFLVNERKAANHIMENTGGNGLSGSLTGKLKSLMRRLDTCKIVKNQLYQARANLEHLKNTTVKDENNQDVSNSAIERMQETIKTHEKNLSEQIKYANNIIDHISNIRYEVPNDSSEEGSSGGGSSSGSSGGQGGGQSGSQGGGDPTKTLNSGDTVKVKDKDGKEKVMIYKGTTDDGEYNVYVDGNPYDNRHVYVQDQDGNLIHKKVSEDYFNEGTNEISVDRKVFSLADLKKSTSLDDSKFSRVGYGYETREKLTEKKITDELSNLREESISQKKPATSTSSSNTSKDKSNNPVTVVQNDYVNVGGRVVNYFGTTENGKNIYVDVETKNILYQDKDDNTLKETNSNFNEFSHSHMVVLGDDKEYATAESLKRKRTYYDSDAPFIYVADGEFDKDGITEEYVDN